MEINLNPAIGVYHVRLGWIWIIYFGVRLFAGFLKGFLLLITDLIR